MHKLKYKIQFIAVIAMLFICANSSFAANLDSIIKKSDINNNATVAVSVKDAKTGHVVYEYNEHKMMNPASVQKIFTMRSAYAQLGEDFVFNTAAYVDSKSNLYIKLSADPSLTTGQLKILMQKVKEHYKKPINDIVLDPTVIDNKQWGIGWMWDDDTNALLPKYSPFTVNENKIDISIEPAKNAMMPSIKNKSRYNMVIVNMLKNGSADSISPERKPWKHGDLTYIKGTVKNPVKLTLPVDAPERYFVDELTSAMNSAGLKRNGTVKTAPMPAGLTKVAEVSSRPLSELIANTLKNSNNLYSELIFKTAAAGYTKAQGTTEDAVEMFNKYFASIKSDKPIVVDACGISRNDLISADWTTEALNMIYKADDFDKFESFLAKPIEGTLSDRLLNISLKLRAKTGTASAISSIAGYIDTKSGKKYSFAIYVQNHNKSTLDVKRFEDALINEIYKM